MSKTAAGIATHGKVSRNQPCPCGSGKKYKMCCLVKSETAALSYPQEVRRRACDALMDFAMRKNFDELRDAFATLFFGPDFDDLPLSDRERVLKNEAIGSNFSYWLTFEATMDGPTRTFASRFLSSKGHLLALPERRYLEAMKSSHLHLYEVEDVRIDVGLRLRDCWDGTVHEISERLATHSLTKYSVAALRLRPEPNGALVIDGPGFAGFSHADKDAIIEDLRGELEAAMETDGNADGRFEFYHGVVIAQHYLHDIILRPPPQITTTSGDPLVFCTVVFDVMNAHFARVALSNLREFEADNDADCYVWVRGAQRSVHASVRFENGRLIAETQSVKRAMAVKKVLERALAGAARYRETQEQSLESALADRRNRPEEPAEPIPPPPEIAAYLADEQDRYYHAWIDTPIPALANKTPRQASRFRALRGALVGLLKDFTSSSERACRAGQFAYDFDWMWGELGIDPQNPSDMRVRRNRKDVVSGATARSSSKANRANVYRLKVSLLGAKPPIWRRVLIGGNERLDRVHMILNRVMGWYDSHLHLFEILGTRYSVPAPGEPWTEKDERKVRLADLPLTVGSSFDYWYDFGDDWVHRVVVEGIEASEASSIVPTCEGGRRACPPEDIGGVYGFRDFLKAPERWPEYGFDGFDPEAFDREAANSALSDLPKKWEPMW